MDIYFKFNMLVTSFFPLWVNIVIKNVYILLHKIYKQNSINVILVMKIMKANVVGVIFTVVISLITILSILYIEFFLYKKRKEDFMEGRVYNVCKENKLSSEFLLFYILPMLVYDFFIVLDLVLFLVYFCLLAFVCIRNNNLYTNMYLELRGYKLFKCDMETNVMGENKIYKNSLVISKNDLTMPCYQNVKYYDVTNLTYINLEGEKLK